MSNERLDGAAASTPVSGTLSGASVLLAEHDAIVAGLYSEHLSRAGMVVHTAPTGVEAIALASRVDPDVMLLDIDLPGISGIEVLRMMSSSATLSRIPIIVLSNDANPWLEADSWALGAVGYFVHGQATPARLLAQLQIWLGAVVAHVQRTDAKTATR